VTIDGEPVLTAFGFGSWTALVAWEKALR